MYRLIDEPRNEFSVVHADLEHMVEPAELLTELILKLAKQRSALTLPRLGEAFKSLLSGVRKTFDELELLEIKIKLREQTQRNWQDVGDSLFAQLAAMHTPILFILDELPMMIDRMARSSEHRKEAVTLLRWLRRLRVAPEMSNIHFLVAGSIGIDYVLQDLGEATSINDFERLRLEPFSPRVAHEFLDVLSQTHDVPISPVSRKKILELIGEPVPYFLQIMFSEIQKAHPAGGDKATPTKIERLYHERVLGIDCKTYFEHYYGRLRDYYQPQEEKSIKRLLRELAIAGTLSRSNTHAIYRDELGRAVELDEFNSVMTNLENDFYVKQNATTHDYDFSCKLLRDWWLRYYGMAV